MKNIVAVVVVAALSLASVASADRGDRHYPRGDDRYARQRYEASVRYERGSRNYEHTYVRYGQDNYSRRPSYDRDYVRPQDRGVYYHNSRSKRSTWGFSFGYSSRYGYAGDSVSLGVYYSNRPAVAYRYPGYSYYRGPDIYQRHPHVYVDDGCSYDVYEYRNYRVSPGYYGRYSGSISVRGGYYHR